MDKDVLPEPLRDVVVKFCKDGGLYGESLWIDGGEELVVEPGG